MIDTEVKLSADVRKVRIGDTIYIVESTVSENARESATDKVKKLILRDLEGQNKLSNNFPCNP